MFFIANIGNEATFSSVDFNEILQVERFRYLEKLLLDANDRNKIGFTIWLTLYDSPAVLNYPTHPLYKAKTWKSH